MNDALAGRTLTSTDFRVPQLAAADLAGQTVLAVVSRGKHMLTRTDAGLTLHTHYRMDGAWHLYRPGSRWRGGPDWQVRAVLTNADWQAVGYRLPILELIETSAEQDVVGHLGPDLLTPQGEPGGWDEAEAVTRLSTRPDREIAPALIDQRNLAGIGNLYKSETLFLSGISPWTRVGDIADLAGVVRRARRLMDVNRQHWSQSTTGNLRRGEEHWVFERSGRPCRRCGTTIRSAEQAEVDRADQARLTYWCPSCQPGPAPVQDRQREAAPAARRHGQQTRRS
jgi:endonuclease-8